MQQTTTSLEGLMIINPRVFGDDRGYFFESYQREKFRELGIDKDFVQDNESKSMKGVLRGLHFQSPPDGQGKLVRVVKGSVLDISVDIRTSSPTYGKWEAIILDEKEKKMLWVPEGFAHGFLVLEDNTVFQYKCTGYYNREAEGAVRWNDPDLDISWGISNPLLSDKDRQAPLFKDLKSPF